MTHEFALSSSFFSFPVWHATRYRAESRVVTIQGEVSTNRSVVPVQFSTSTIMSSDLDITKCFEFAKELMLHAGKILESSFESKKEVYDKGELDFVTDVDYKIEKIFIDALSKQFPDHKIIAEETIGMEKIPELTDAPTWFLDPIDGTTNLIHSFPHVCISLGLTVCKELVLGIIYNPLCSELYSAIKGEGAFLNEKPIHTSKITELKKALLFCDSSILKIMKKNKDIHAARFDALIEMTQTTRNTGSGALALAYIARGAVDCFHYDGLRPWDVAAGTLIIREAGGTIIDTKGGAYDIMNPHTIAAANEILAREMSKVITDTDLKT
ncbi:inositol-phosphate phosphatase isoform X1 [Solenopsis invicta]|uniref:inositol-phosphate phosphatase isoform X1 n=2 Tax=Solenopsis invicta TaxID=13686 RepID=UPI000595E0EA|nr:inositol-phosphate phosphatase isoform X1 [Solenopsis invicta]XP_039306571.1 inositol-phosphate phosphatase isoform X1 [Solenopsis invicta]XP_039306575.1 inositol-phosphate phosphatase isoform X1 [Solenopsis invicta]